MKIEKTNFEGVYIIKLEPIIDERGFFSRLWCKKEFLAHHLDDECVQINLSFNNLKNTLRGMHYQKNPHSETKIVRCVRGSIYDVIIDLRKKSETYKQWMGVNLNEENKNMIYIPKGFAHGFLTLEDNTEVLYQMSEYYRPSEARGIRFDDPAFSISWPLIDKPIISEKDNSWPEFKPLGNNF